jgi:hypothetical protein
MKEMWRGILIGLAVAAIVGAILVPRYGAWRQKLGHLQGKKEGMIDVIDFLARYFPKPDGRPVEAGPQIGLKWYTVNVIETNGITTLQVNNEM